MKALIFNPIMLCVIIIVFSGTLINTPLQSTSIILNLIILAILFVLVIKAAIDLLFKKARMTFSFPYLMLLAALPIMAAVTANLNFGQDFISGINAGYQFYNYLIIIYFYYYFKLSKDSLATLENCVLILGWVLLVFFYFLKVSMPNLTFEVASFDGATTYRYQIYLLSSYLIPWTGIIYLSKFKETSKLKHLFFSFIFISYQFTTMHARAFTIALFIVLFIFFLRELTGTLRIYFTSAIIFLAAALVILSLTVSQVADFFEEKSELFTDAVDAASGHEGRDVSANARIDEVATAQKYLHNNYFFGVGNLKSSTQEKFMKDYFYAMDIGLLGVVFTYGLFGLTILSYQLKFFFSKFSSSRLKFNPFLVGTAYYLLLQYINSIANGQFVFRIGCSFMLLSIIFFGSESVFVLYRKTRKTISSSNLI